MSDRVSSPRPGEAGPGTDNPPVHVADDLHPLRPTALEIASGKMYGEHQDAPALDVDSRPCFRTPLAALEHAVLPALQRPPCLVSFSGGRDSSAVLAAATRAASREGLPPPVPITLRVRNAPRAEESEWQERVISHLGLREWEVQEVGEEMDRLGPLSVAVLRRHRVLFPPNTFLQLPLLEAARGGPLLSGFGGDELFASWWWRYHADLFARRRGPRPRDALSLTLSAFPAGVRRWREGRRSRWGEELPWLRPAAASMVSELVVAAHAEQPRSWSRWVGWFMRRRMLCASRWSLSLLAADVDTLLLHPLLDPDFVAAVATAGGHLGFGDRTAAMREIFSEALPRAVLSRQTKARYGEAFWGRRAREFAERWRGGGIDSELVDSDALRGEWLKPYPHDDTAMLMHAAWLSENGDGFGLQSSPPHRATGQGSRSRA
jgi:hypothetical protein